MNEGVTGLLQHQEWLLEQGQHRPEAAAWCRGCFPAIMGPAGLSHLPTSPSVLALKVCGPSFRGAAGAKQAGK